jgi:hypothetical protein
MQHYLGVAKKEGVTEQEIGAAQSIVMAVAAGRINAQFRDARTQSKKPAAEEKPSKCCDET